MFQRIPQWKLIKNHRSASKQKSVRYKPSRLNQQNILQKSEKGGLRQIVQNISQDTSEIASEKNRETKSFFNYHSDSKLPRRSEGNFKGAFRSDSYSGSKSRSISKSNIHKQKKLISRITLNFQSVLIEKVHDKDTAQNQFKHYLRFIENMERDFVKRKSAMERVLEEKQEKIKSTRAAIIYHFARREDQIQDPQLRRAINCTFSGQNKSQKRQIFQFKLDRVQQQVLDQALKMKYSESKGSAGEWAKRKFGLIFETLGEMKNNLDECQKLRGSKSKEKNTLIGKKTMVNNQLKIQSKKTYE